MILRHTMVTIVLGAALVVGCDYEPTTPGEVSVHGADPEQPQQPEPAVEWPPVDGAVMGVFDRVSPYRDELKTSLHHGGSLASRYVLYEDGTFTLQYLSASQGFFEYPGTYSIATVEIVFDFDDSNSAGPWLATATLEGDCLTVEYNIVMWLADFSPGEYCRPS